MEQYFTFIPVLQTLAAKLIGGTGTIQRNRIRGGVESLSNEKTMKRQARSTSKEIFHEEITVVQ